MKSHSSSLSPSDMNDLRSEEREPVPQTVMKRTTIYGEFLQRHVLALDGKATVESTPRSIGPSTSGLQVVQGTGLRDNRHD